MKLNNFYSIISNKTVRKNESFYKRFPGHKSVPGTLVKTNRGYFIDGYQVDMASVELYKSLIKSAKIAQSK